MIGICGGYEYEFDGELNGTVNSQKMDMLSLKSVNGFGELD